ncbi:hypothetical protein ATY41_04790 [Leifsonia xyli subsp. xyli]|uniref:SipW-cognate class signal peptide n=1 Tax=Leifsonia xyli subsp. xyli TaxID=59736 RepID=A0A1E2SIA5_LEIXY|nr:SipW-dependent-type signal peptide-containing protein [Leifsonia xyli]ODA89596.1 hypothetical protein ATY41_04790 [Leifsonia xyli subsp. xyli]
MTDTDEDRVSGRRRKLQAVLATGLMLGAGATVTLAAWSDSEYATGTFSAGTFNLVGSTDGTTFTDHATSGAAAALLFTVNTATLSPTDVTASPFAVQLAANTTNNATVTISSSTTTGSIANLTYQLLQTTSFGCTATTTGTTLVTAGTAVGSVPSSTTFSLAKGTSGAAGSPVYLCFKVTAGSGLVQGQTGTATWQFQAAGVLLGSGAGTTLASWTDAEFGGASFTGSVFATESSANGGAYADNTTAPGASLTMSGAFAPGVSVYVPVLIRTKAASVAGTATLNGATLGGTDVSTLGAALVYRVVRTTGTCAASAFAGSPAFVGASGVARPLTAGQEAGVSNPLIAATASTPGTATGLCFEITLPTAAANSLQGKTATATWLITAVSS